MTATTLLALKAPDILPVVFDRWSLRWPAIVVALLIPVIILRIADWRLRAAN